MKKTIFILLALAFVAGCREPEPAAPELADGPELVSSDPADGADDIIGDVISVTLTFNQNVMCPTSERGRISIDSGAELSDLNPYMKDITVKVSGLVPSQKYTLVFPEGTILGYGNNQKPAKEIRLTFSVKSPCQQDIAKSLVTENPTANARRLYEYMLSIYGKKTLSGAIAKVAWNRDEAEWIHKWTGKWPAMATFDYIHLQSSPSNWIDYSDITPAREWFEMGGIVSACWHWNVPAKEGSSEYTCTPGDGSQASDGTWTTVFRPSRIFEEGTWENRTVKADLEKMAGYLRLLQDAGIPVVWRPLHEAAGNTYTQWHSGAWFWWGADGGETYVRLWRYMFDYFKEAGIRNLIWVWTTQASSYGDMDMPFYPGDGYVDIIGRDIYNVASEAVLKNNFGVVTEMFLNKMVALSEHGGVSDMNSQWNAGAKWLYFMPWYDYGLDGTEGYAHTHADIAWWKKTWACDDVIDLSALPADLFE